MKVKTLLVPVLITTLLSLANFSPPPDGLCDSPVVGGHTGAPGETSCAGCHDGTANTGPGSLHLLLSDTTLRYTPGEIFDAKVVLRQTGIDKFGFVGLALKDAGNTTIGTFTIDDAVRTRTYNDGPRKYVSHTPCGADATPADSLSWTFHWKAPATNVGNITLYLAGLAANHDHALSGDDTYTLAVHLVPENVSSVSDPALGSRLRLWPNPASEVLHCSIDGGAGNGSALKAEIWSADGCLISSTELVQNTLSVAALKSGVYRIRITNEKDALLAQSSFVKR